ncbi:MAG TPA: SDR family oxidoreductase, partial [Sphingopyxis sp.]|uniref:SDR family NAD(P)-dependent oxidoreductase n=1 Tax=Sphingopyxis sp. TaxID=1908224 RepID=UPI002BB0F1DC
IGEAVAAALASAGAHVHCADIREAAARAVAAKVHGTPVVLDVADRAAFFDAIDAAASATGLHVVCNLAGIAGRSQRVVDLDEEAFDAMFAAHFGGVLHGCQAALPHLRRAGGGAIVNMSSEAIDIAPATIASYAVAKVSISSLTKILAAEVAADNIRVNAIAPSFIPSELSLVRYAGDPEGRERYLDWWRAKSPLGELCSVDDVAAQILYLVSDAAGYVTGQTLRTNGGISMPW